MGKEQLGKGSFIEQFGERLDFGIINIPERAPGKRPIFFIPGWDSKLSDNADILESICLASDARLVSAQFIEFTEYEKAEEIGHLAELMEIEDVDVVAHSLGGFSAILAILEGRIKPHGVALVNPAGMAIDPESSTKKVEGELRRLYIELLRSERGSVGSQNVGGVDGISDMAEFVAGFGMYEKLREIRDMGIKMITVHGENDKLSPWVDVKRAADGEDWVEGKDAFFIEGLSHMGISEIISDVLEKLAA